MQQRLHTLHQREARAARFPFARGSKQIHCGRKQHPDITASTEWERSPPCLCKNQSRSWKSSADTCTEAVGMSHLPVSSEEPLRCRLSTVRGWSGPGSGSGTARPPQPDFPPFPTGGRGCPCRHAAGTLAGEHAAEPPLRQGTGWVGAAHSAQVKR